MQNKPEKTKDELILATYRKMRRFFKNLDKDRMEIADKLCKKAAFMDVTLNELQEKITEEGAVIEGVNGNGFKVKMDNPAIRSYNTMFKNYSAAMKQLIELLPETGQYSDKFMTFVMGRKK